MHTRTSDYLPESVAHAGDQIQEYVRERPSRSLLGLLMIGLLVAIGIWGWPELHRTVHIHRM